MSLQVGRGIADITGEPADCELLGYGKSWQRSNGLHTRLRSRAFVFDDGQQRVLLIVNDLPLVFSSLHQAVLARLAAQYGEQYTEANVLITATHTHCGPGGYSHHLLYNLSNGFHPQTFDAIVDGVLEAVERAHADVTPSTLTLAHGELHDASINRSRVAFERNPQADREFFPHGIDPQTTVLRIERDGGRRGVAGGGRLCGVINWFATHGTSMTNQNRLISSDNKGYAALHWEREVEGVNYVEQPEPAFISAFAQTNAGDMSPNLNQRGSDIAGGTTPRAPRVRRPSCKGQRRYAVAGSISSRIAGGYVVPPAAVAWEASAAV